jgi:tellurite resistance-related uncharacterized protein
MFFVENGKLEVNVWKNDYDLMDKTILGPQQTCIVKPGEYHLFKCMEDDTVVFEVYWVEIEEGDIDRVSVGGEGDK